jgi:hypothetical protein
MIEPVLFEYVGNGTTIAGRSFANGDQAYWRHEVDADRSSIPDEWWECKIGDDWVRHDMTDWKEVQRGIGNRPTGLPW